MLCKYPPTLLGNEVHHIVCVDSRLLISLGYASMFSMQYTVFVDFYPWQGNCIVMKMVLAIVTEARQRERE